MRRLISLFLLSLHFLLLLSQGVIIRLPLYIDHDLSYKQNMINCIIKNWEQRMDIMIVIIINKRLWTA